MNCHIFVVWSDDQTWPWSWSWSDIHGHDPLQEDISKTGKFGCCQSQVDAGGSEVDHPRLLDHDGQGVGRLGPRRSMGGPAGSQEVNREV